MKKLMLINIIGIILYLSPFQVHLAIYLLILVIDMIAVFVGFSMLAMNILGYLKTDNKLIMDELNKQHRETVAEYDERIYYAKRKGWIK